MAASLKEFGWRQPVVVDEEMVILAGHTRLEAARRLGWTEAPVHIARGLTPAQARAYRLMDNRSNENAEWDEALLGLEFRPATHEIFLRNPQLPQFLDEVILRNLQVGSSVADLKVSRHGEEVSLAVLRTRGPIQASVIQSS